MQNRANECVAYDPIQAGWIDVTNDMGQRWVRSNTDVNLPYGPNSGRRSLAAPHGGALLASPSDVPLGAMMMMVFVGAMAMIARQKRVHAHVKKQPVIL
jgi:hypothetical protein